MNKVKSGSTRISLVNPDAAGNYGYSLSFDYKYQESDPEGTIEYTNIQFSGPGTWGEFSEGDDYPYPQMFTAVMNENNM